MMADGQDTDFEVLISNSEMNAPKSTTKSSGTSRPVLQLGKSHVSPQLPRTTRQARKTRPIQHSDGSKRPSTSINSRSCGNEGSSSPDIDDDSDFEDHPPRKKLATLPKRSTASAKRPTPKRTQGPRKLQPGESMSCQEQQDLCNKNWELKQNFKRKSESYSALNKKRGYWKQKACDVKDENAGLKAQLSDFRTQNARLTSSLKDTTAELMKRHHVTAEPDNIVREKFDNLRSNWDEWGKQYALKPLHGNYEVSAMSALNYGCCSESSFSLQELREMLFSDKSGPRLLLTAFLAHAICDSIFASPFFLLRDSERNTDQEDTRMMLDRILQYGLKVDQSRASAWRIQTLELQDPKLESIATAKESSQKDGKLSFYTDLTDHLLHIGRDLMRELSGVDAEVRRDELYTICEEAGDLNRTLSKSRAQLDVVCRFPASVRFSCDSKYMLPHRSMLIDTDERSPYEGREIGLVVMPLVLAYGNEAGENYDLDKVWSKAVVWLPPTQASPSPATGPIAEEPTIMALDDTNEEQGFGNMGAIVEPHIGYPDLNESTNQSTTRNATEQLRDNAFAQSRNNASTELQININPRTNLTPEIKLKPETKIEQEIKLEAKFKPEQEVKTEPGTKHELDDPKGRILENSPIVIDDDDIEEIPNVPYGVQARGQTAGEEAPHGKGKETNLVTKHHVQAVANPRDRFETDPKYPEQRHTSPGHSKSGKRSKESTPPQLDASDQHHAATHERPQKNLGPANTRRGLRSITVKHVEGLKTTMADDFYQPPRNNLVPY